MVIADFERRKAFIKAGAEKAAAALGGVADIEESLLEEVTSLVEWPVILDRLLRREVPGRTGRGTGLHHEGRPEVLPCL